MPQTPTTLIIGGDTHPHSHSFERDDNSPYWLLGYLNSGRILTTTKQGSFTREARTISLIPPHNAYSLRWNGTRSEAEIWRETYCLFLPAAHWEPLLQWPIKEHGFGILTISEKHRREEVENELQRGKRLLRSARPNKVALAANAIERILLLLDEINPLRGRKVLDPRVLEALDFISDHYAEIHSVQILAETACLSDSHFAHLFRSQMNMAPMRYLERYRLERAAEKLLSSNLAVNQIAHQCGFVNAYHFSKRFKLHFGQSPRDYKTGSR